MTGPRQPHRGGQVAGQKRRDHHGGATTLAPQGKQMRMVGEVYSVDADATRLSAFRKKGPVFKSHQPCRYVAHGTAVADFDIVLRDRHGIHLRPPPLPRRAVGNVCRLLEVGKSTGNISDRRDDGSVAPVVHIHAVSHDVDTFPSSYELSKQPLKRREFLKDLAGNPGTVRSHLLPTTGTSLVATGQAGQYGSVAIRQKVRIDTQSSSLTEAIVVIKHVEVNENAVNSPSLIAAMKEDLRKNTNWSYRCVPKWGRTLERHVGREARTAAAINQLILKGVATTFPYTFAARFDLQDRSTLKARLFMEQGGMPLDERLAQKQFYTQPDTVNTVRSLLAQVVCGFYAYKRVWKMNHNDLHPGNVLIFDNNRKQGQRGGGESAYYLKLPDHTVRKTPTRDLAWIIDWGFATSDCLYGADDVQLFFDQHQTWRETRDIPPSQWRWHDLVFLFREVRGQLRKAHSNWNIQSAADAQKLVEKLLQTDLAREQEVEKVVVGLLKTLTDAATSSEAQSCNEALVADLSLTVEPGDICEMPTAIPTYSPTLASTAQGEIPDASSPFVQLRVGEGIPRRECRGKRVSCSAEVQPICGKEVG